MEPVTHQILRRKIENQDVVNQQLGVYVTYAEVLILVDYYGVIPVDRSWKVQYSRDKVSQGLSGSTWFHFTRKKNSKI
jgi:hypothetical protein